MTLNGGLVCGEMLCIFLKLGSLKIMQKATNFQVILCTSEFVWRNMTELSPKLRPKHHSKAYTNSYQNCCNFLLLYFFPLVGNKSQLEKWYPLKFKHRQIFVLKIKISLDWRKVIIRFLQLQILVRKITLSRLCFKPPKSLYGK